MAQCQREIKPGLRCPNKAGTQALCWSHRPSSARRPFLYGSKVRP